MLKLMQKGTVMVDVSVDQAVALKPHHNHSHRSSLLSGRRIALLCCQHSRCGPITSTRALTNATLPYVVKLAELGWKEACRKHEDIKSGLNIVDGKIVFKNVAESLELPYTEYQI
jgi:alanine dehydrogenase